MRRALFPVSGLVLLLLAGCGGSGTDAADLTPATRVAQFSDPSPDFSGDATDLDLTGAKLSSWSSNGETRHAFQAGRPDRNVQVALPANAAAGETYSVALQPVVGTSPHAYLYYSQTDASPTMGTTYRIFSGAGGTITVLSRTATRTLVRLNDVQLVPSEMFVLSKGSAKISGTVEATPLP